jgi:hypothetical protein
MNEQEVRTLLADLADTPTPPSRVDVPRAMTVARRQARVRTWATTVAASVLVVGLAVGATYVVNSPPATTSVAAVRAPARFDSLVRYASFGWLPAESAMMTWRYTDIDEERFAIGMRKSPSTVSSPDGPAVNASFYVARQEPESKGPLVQWGPPGFTGESASVTDAPAVGGARAYWVTVPGVPDMIILRWRYATDGWAEVTVSRLAGDLRQIAHRVAIGLRAGGTERLRFPFRLSGVPAGMRHERALISEGLPYAPWSADLTLLSGTHDSDEGLSINVSIHGKSPVTRNSNFSVDGHQALRQTNLRNIIGIDMPDARYGDSLVVYDDVRDVESRITVGARTQADVSRVGPEMALGVYRGLTLFPDRADWTGQPLR